MPRGSTYTKIVVKGRILRGLFGERTILLGKLKAYLRTGIRLRLGSLEATFLQLRRIPSGASGSLPPVSTGKPAVDLASPTVAFLREGFPGLHDLGLDSYEEDPEGVLQVLYGMVPLLNQASRGAHLRGLLTRLAEQTPSEAVRREAIRAIAVSDLADGIPDRSSILRADPKWASNWREQTAALESAYGAPLISKAWAEADRGATMRWFFEEHPEWIDARDVLHIAPEPDLRDFVRPRARRYATLDADPRPGIDIVADLRRTGLQSDSFDLIICNRVLEHVTDDRAAMYEMHRLLKSSGTLQVSVPQSMHRGETIEWVVPDDSQHGHVRQYGRDFADRLAAVGFQVSVETWLLEKPETELRKRRAFPMRFYWARKR